MKLSRVVFLTIILIFGNSLFYSCCRNSCGCGEPPEPFFYKVTNYETSIRQYLLNSNNRPYSNPVLVEKSTTSFDDMAIVLSPLIQGISHLKTNFSIPGIAFACSPAEEPTQTYLDISIVSNADFQTANRTFSSGENIASLFDIYDYGIQKSITSFLYSGTNYAYYSSFYFLLITPPAFESLHKFTITIKLSDGSIIDATTTSIKILP